MPEGLPDKTAAKRPCAPSLPGPPTNGTAVAPSQPGRPLWPCGPLRAGFNPAPTLLAWGARKMRDESITYRTQF